jgi:radical SAM-linked protein
MSMRLRLTFSKAGAMQYVGHLDLHRSWERAFRRSGLAIEYSQGFHPQPHLSLACALPVGFTSQCELLDAWLQQDCSLKQVAQALAPALPPGLELIQVQQIDPQSPALQTLVSSAVYRITFLDHIPDLEIRLRNLLAADHLPRLRRDKPYDLRPLIESATLLEQDGQNSPLLQVQMASRQSATGRPEELLAEMAIKFENARIHREKLILSSG